MTSLDKIVAVIVTTIALIRSLAAENAALKKELAELKAKTAAEEEVLNQHIDQLQALLGTIAPTGSTGGIGG